MAIPLAHFQVSPPPLNQRPPRKLLCFADHRQRAAAFPSLLEEETFTHDLSQNQRRCPRCRPDRNFCDGLGKPVV
jgi:hypothetical protein